MKKTWTVLFVIYNIVSLGFTFMGMGLVPDTLLFNWWPSQHFVFTMATYLNAIVWGVYFKKYLDERAYLDDMYKDA